GNTEQHHHTYFSCWYKCTNKMYQHADHEYHVFYNRCNRSNNNRFACGSNRKLGRQWCYEKRITNNYHGQSIYLHCNLNRWLREYYCNWNNNCNTKQYDYAYFSCWYRCTDKMYQHSDHQYHLFNDRCNRSYI